MTPDEQYIYDHAYTWSEAYGPPGTTVENSQEYAWWFLQNYGDVALNDPDLDHSNTHTLWLTERARESDPYLAL